MEQSIKDREQLAKELQRLKYKYREQMHGRMVPSPRAMETQRKINDVKDKILRMDRDAAERLALENAPIDEVLEIIAIPLLADVINDVVAGVNATLRRHGVQETVFGIYTNQIRSAALAIVDTLDHADANLPKLLDVDDMLVDAIRKKLMSFIKQRLKINK